LFAFIIYGNAVPSRKVGFFKGGTLALILFYGVVGIEVVME
jgi:hypothetical protein